MQTDVHNASTPAFPSLPGRIPIGGGRTVRGPRVDPITLQALALSEPPVKRQGSEAVLLTQDTEAGPVERVVEVTPRQAAGFAEFARTGSKKAMREIGSHESISQSEGGVPDAQRAAEKVESMQALTRAVVGRHFGGPVKMIENMFTTLEDARVNATVPTRTGGPSIIPDHRARIKAVETEANLLGITGPASRVNETENQTNITTINIGEMAGKSSEEIMAYMMRRAAALRGNVPLEEVPLPTLQAPAIAVQAAAPFVLPVETPDSPGVLHLMVDGQEIILK